MFTVASVLVDSVRFTPAVTEAMRAFARSKPFRGDADERQAKWRTFHESICAAVEVTAGLDFNNVELGGSSLLSGIAAGEDGTPCIVLVGKLSVVTYLYLLGGLMGQETHADKMKWAANLFRKFFPRSFAGLRTDGAYLTR